jgi:hypothetical protein
MNTAQKLEKLDLERKRVAKITSIKWEDPPPSAAGMYLDGFLKLTSLFIHASRVALFVSSHRVAWSKMSLELICIVFVDNISAAFEKKPIDKSKKDAAKSKKTSTLSAQLKDCPVLQKNPFLDYSMFDGNVMRYLTTFQGENY